MLILLVLASSLSVISVATTTTDWYHSYWCGHGLQYLDDGKCAKKFPMEYNRDWTCPISIVDEVPDQFVKDGDLSEMNIDTTSLSKYVTDDAVNVCAVVTKRVKDATAEKGFSLYNRYFCAGDKSAYHGYETWSSSKIFAMANAAGHMRSNESHCGSGNAHNYLFGFDGTVTGKHDVTPLGDLATVVCSYDTTAGYSSNSLSSYFHDIGWRDRINYLLHDWLKVSSNQTLGGNYGEATPSDLGFTVTENDISDGSSTTCSVDKDPWPTKYDNTISALTEVELTRRIALHRELPQALRFPGIQWEDIQHILYGSESSLLFPGLKWGGMSTDISIFLQSTKRMTELLSDSNHHQDQWRIFSKLGAGWSTSRYRGEIVGNAYTCIPNYEDGQEKGGLEFTITVRGSVPNDPALTAVEQKVYTAFDQAVNFIYDTFSAK